MYLLQRSVGEHRALLSKNIPDDDTKGSDSTLMDVSTFCTPLKNMQSYFSAPVSFGTPAQTVDAVVDTGSGPLVIESCYCKDHGYCEANSHCVTSADSTTLTDTGGLTQTLAYGSGEVKTKTVTDIAKFANIEAKMDRAIMLVTETKMEVSMPEGIIGFGLPGGDLTGGFLKFGYIQSFSVCFNREGGKDGSMVLSQSIPQPGDATKLGQIGTSHWLLELQGAAVGEDVSSAAPVDICGAEKCVFIPDTGTTNILLPTEQYSTVLSTMCDSWERCKTKVKDEKDAVKKSTAFTDLLQDCGSWLGKDGVDELPSLHLNLKGASGTQTTVTLSPWAWVVMTEVQQVKSQMVDDGYGTVQEMPVATGQSVKACVPALSPADFGSKEAGPLWVVGLPLFYEYTVNFDLSTNPYSIAFSEQPCATCASTHLFGESESLKEKRVRVKGQEPRPQNMPPRSIYIDPSKPL